MSMIVNKFPEGVIRAAKTAEASTGCPAVLTLAQWALESGYGKFDLGAHNYFGLKWSPQCGRPFVIRNTREWIGGETGYYITIGAKFIKFDSMEQCFEFHGRCLFQGPYLKCSIHQDSWLDFLNCIAPIYATDRDYTKKLLEIIKENKLDKL